MHDKHLILYRNDEEIILPHKWEICGHCEGEGKSSAYLGTFTREDMNEMDDDFREDYIRGRLDRPCECCGGSGKIKAVDEDRLNAEDLADWRAQQEEERACRETERMERLMEGGWREEGWYGHD